ncbi:MAG: site-2 protease family protein, partial [Cytophagales bacterium]|nr:site-2 protease family protein [Cytophagales bacterium]
MSIIITILQVVLGMTIIVGLHELGHMLLAKLLGMRIESFTIGFPPKIFKKKIGQTEYGIGAVPLGGYVNISGMIDESSVLDEEGEKENSQQAKPYEFRAKPAWQRMIVILGGIIMNFFLGITIYIFLTFSSGSTYFSKDEVNKYGITITEIGRQLGFQEGDKILTINGKNFEDFKDIFDPINFIETGKATILEVENQAERREVILH